MSDTAHIADNVLSLLHHVHAPAADCVAPFLPRLFAALADGHTFIYLNKEETAQLARAQPIVGADAQSPLVLYRNRLFLAKFWQLEQHLAREIHRLSHYRRLPERWDFIQQQLQAWFADSGSQDQQAAAALTLLHNFMLISGAGNRQNHHRCQIAGFALPRHLAAHCFGSPNRQSGCAYVGSLKKCGYTH